jgi:glucose-1-phosphate cytidylyltransferase
MKVIILAGGFGTRLSEYTQNIPKPMIEIGGKPIIWHIMQTYSHFGHNEFFVALGYKSEVIKNYFLNYQILNSNFSVDLSSGQKEVFDTLSTSWKVNLIETGENSMTGGRVKRMKDFIKDDICMLTYGDGLSNVNISELLKYHKSHGKLVTMTAVRPAARFGELEIKDGMVSSFEEKPQLGEGWINGGYFVFNRDFFDYIDSDSTFLEREPLERAAKEKELMAFQHKDFWMCMDSKRDHDNLESLWNRGETPWILE